MSDMGQVVRILCRFLLSWTLCISCFGAEAKLQRGGATSGEWSDCDGIKVNPLKPQQGECVVLLFAMTDCPVANSYAPEVNRIVAKYSAKGVHFFVVYVDPGISVQAAKVHAHEYGFQCTALLDPQRTLAKRVGATVSPQAIVIGPKGAIVYRGRIDDRVVAYGKHQPAPKRQDLRLTLDAVLSGQKPPLAHTPCVGCVISTSSAGKG